MGQYWKQNDSAVNCHPYVVKHLARHGAIQAEPLGQPDRPKIQAEATVDAGPADS